VSGSDSSPAEESRSQPAANERADDSEDDGDDATRRVPPWHQKLGQTPGDEPEKNPIKPERQTLYLREASCVLRNARSTTAPRGHAIDPEQDEGAKYRLHDAPQSKSVEPGTRNHVPEEAADERTNDADDHGNDDAAGVITRHDSLGDRARDQTKNDPCENSHLPSSMGLTSADRMEHRGPAKVQPAYHG